MAQSITWVHNPFIARGSTLPRGPAVVQLLVLTKQCWSFPHYDFLGTGPSKLTHKRVLILKTEKMIINLMLPKFKTVSLHFFPQRKIIH